MKYRVPFLAACLILAQLAGCSGSGDKSDLQTQDQSAEVDSQPSDIRTGDTPSGDQADTTSGDIPEDVAEPLTHLESGPYTLSYDPMAMTLALTRNGQPLLLMPLDAFRLGLVKKLDDTANYDPYPLVAEAPLYTPPEGLEWLEPSSVTCEVSDNEMNLTFTYGQTLSGYSEFKTSLTFIIDGNGRFKATWKPENWKATQTPLAYYRLVPGIDPQEGLYGLGEFFDQVNNRGMVRAMQLEADGALESAYNEAHVPIPLLIGTRGWGLFVETPYPAVFDFTGTSQNRFHALFGTGLASGDGLTFYVMGSDHPLDVTRHYYEITGFPKLPSQWALGPWIWRDENKDQAEVEGDLNAIRDLDLPATGLWIDRPYATGVNTFDYNPAQFPDHVAMIQMMHDLGFRTALWHTPYLDKNDASTEALRNEAEEKSYYPPTYGLLLNKWGIPIDLTNPEAFDWWQELIQKYIDMGVEGFKLDYGEDVVVGLSGIRINVWEFANGEDERTMHERYTLFYHKVYADLLPEGGFLLCRHGAYGDQVHGPIIWPGDLDADMSTHREVVEDDEGGTYGAVGGLPAAVVASISLGPSGFPLFGSDTGGYRHSPPDEETFIRWFQHTALSSVMQIGTSSNDVAWEFFNNENDPDGKWLAHYRDMTRLHLRLFPYEWTYAANILTDGRAIQRPLGLAWPELGVHPSDTYMFGDHLLVAPVIQQGAVERTVHFPPGTWIDWFTGEVFEGNKEVTVAAPLDKLPLYLGQGGIVPMLRPTIDTLAPTTQPDRVDSMATDPGFLYVAVFPSEIEASFVVYDGSAITSESTQTEVLLSYETGTIFNAGAVFEVLGSGSEPPNSVNVAGSAAVQEVSMEALEAAQGPAWFFSPERGGVLYIKIIGSADVAITQ